MSSIADKVLTEDHLKAIGLVAAEWSYTEIFLEQLIWEIAGIESNHGHAITTHIASENRINILASLADLKITNEEHKLKIKSLITAIKDLRPHRNNIVHSFWLSTFIEDENGFVSKGNPVSVKVLAKGKVNITKTPITVSEINDIAEKIANLAHDLHNFQRELKAIRLHRK